MKTTLRFIAVFFLALSLDAFAQEQSTKTDQSDETIRISSELVQTDVMVFDKQGRFIDGLKPEQFRLTIDGKPHAINFFERVIAGSAQEEKAQLKARGGTTSSTATTLSATVPGRTIIFFIDDFHISAASLERVKKAILKFVDNEMTSTDHVHIKSATGQLGFLEQLTDNKAVLRAAVAKLSYRQFAARDGESIPMTEYQAIRISKGDRDAIGYYVTQLQQATNYRQAGGNMGPPPGGVGVAGQRVTQGSGGPASPDNIRYEAQVKRRAENIISQSIEITSNSLRSLQNLMIGSAQLPGRKLIFFVSDGFFLIDSESGAGAKLQQITDAAARAGVVIYSMDARGMTNFTDASSNRSDPIGQLSRSNTGELSASQDALSALASDTGGRALFNSDALNAGFTNALKETSNYYLLAWQPVTEEQKVGSFKKLEVSVVGMPDVTVRLPRGYFDAQARAEQARVDAKIKKQETPAKPETGKSPAEIDLRSALNAYAPRKGLDTLVSASFIDTPNNGPVLIAATQVGTSDLGYGDDGKQPAAIDLVGVVYDDKGKLATSFTRRLKVNPLASNASSVNNEGIVFDFRAPLAAGLYQVRVAARDDKTGHVGSANQWIEIPDLKSNRLTMSSVLLGGHLVETGAKDGGAAGQQMQFSVDRRFNRTSRMSILAFIYNATRNGSAAPDLLGQIQVLRDGQAILSSPQRKVGVEGLEDPGRIPFGSDLTLNSLSAGRYTLQITITDNAAQTTATQRLSFEVL